MFAVDLCVVFHSVYAIYYRPDDKTATIMRVLHGARGLAAILTKAGLEANRIKRWPGTFDPCRHMSQRRQM